jgi:hypothetical protein
VKSRIRRGNGFHFSIDGLTEEQKSNVSELPGAKVSKAGNVSFYGHERDIRQKVDAALFGKKPDIEIATGIQGGKTVAQEFLESKPEAKRAENTEEAKPAEDVADVAEDQVVADEAGTADVLPTVKEPWQMTREEYGKSVGVSEKESFGIAETQSAVAEPNSTTAKLSFGEEVVVGKKDNFHTYTNPKSGKVFKFDVVRTKSPDGRMRFIANYGGSDQVAAGIVIDSDGRAITAKAHETGTGLIQSLLREAKQDFGKIIPQKPISKQGLRALHRSEIEQALSEGKPVPPEVLNDYPDLAPAAPETVETEEKKVTTRQRIPDDDLSTRELVQRIRADYPTQDAQSTYGRFVAARHLKPEIDAKEFGELFNSVGANAHVRTETKGFKPTHKDSVTKELVQFTKKPNGVWEFVSESGRTGGEIPGELPSRYESLAKPTPTAEEQLKPKNPSPENDENIRLFHAGIPGNQLWDITKKFARYINDTRIEWADKGYFQQARVAFERPSKIYGKYKHGKAFKDFVDMTWNLIGHIAGQPTKWMEMAADQLSRTEYDLCRANFKGWIERGEDGRSPDEAWVTPNIRAFEQEYRRMKDYFADLADKAGVLVRRKVAIGEYLAQQTRERARLEGLRDAGEKFAEKSDGTIGKIDDVIQGKTTSINYWKKQSQRRNADGSVTVKFVPHDKDVYEPFSRHMRKNHFAHMMSPEARGALLRGKGKEFRAINEWAIENDVDLKTMIAYADTYSQTADQKFGSMEEMRVDGLPDELVLEDGTVLKMLEQDPFLEMNYYINAASQRIAVIESINQVQGYSDTDVHYRARVTKFIEDIKKGLVEEDGAGVGVASLVNGVWEGFVGSLGQIPFHVSDTPYVQLLLSAETVARTGMLSGGFLVNITGGWFPIAAAGGLRNTAKAVLTITRAGMGNKEAKRELEMARDMMGWTQDYFRYSEETTGLAGKTGNLSRKVLKAVGFEFANRQLNKGASLVAMDFLNQRIDAIKKGHSRTEFYIKELKRNFNFTDDQIVRMVETGKPTTLEVGTVVRTFVAQTNIFRENPNNVPVWMKTEWGRRIVAMTSWVRSMGTILSDGIWEARNGNPRKLATFILGGAATEVVLEGLRGFLADSPDYTDEWWEDFLEIMLGGGTLGLWGAFGNDLNWAFKTRVTPESFTKPLLPAQWEFMAKFFFRMYDYFDKHDKKSLNKLIDTIPIFKYINTSRRRIQEGTFDVNPDKPGRRKSRSRGRSQQSFL